MSPYLVYRCTLSIKTTCPQPGSREKVRPTLLHRTNLTFTGFTADVFGKSLQRTILDPWKTLPLLLLAHYTSKGRDLASRSPRALKALKALAFLGVVRRVNAWLNQRAVNNGVGDHYNWSREVVVLTGGSGGIGRRIADRLGSRGVKVAVLDIQPPSGMLPSSVRFYQCDITSPEAISATAASIRTTLGAPTVLINNAGILPGTTLLGGTERQTRQIFEVNTLAHYWLAREFVPHMVEANHGLVATVASLAGYLTTPNLVDYSASKAAAVSFHEGLAAELVTRYNAPRVRSVLMTQSFTRTGLIDVLTPEDTWFNPLLCPETVAEQLVEQVLAGKSGHIVVPGSSGWFAKHARSLPGWMQHALRNRTERLMRGG